MSKGILIPGVSASQISDFVVDILKRSAMNSPAANCICRENTLFTSMNPPEKWPNPTNEPLELKKFEIQVLNANKEIVTSFESAADPNDSNYTFQNIQTLLADKLNFNDPTSKATGFEYKDILSGISSSELKSPPVYWNDKYIVLHSNAFYASDDLQNWTILPNTVALSESSELWVIDNVLVFKSNYNGETSLIAITDPTCKTVASATLLSFANDTTFSPDVGKLFKLNDTWFFIWANNDGENAQYWNSTDGINWTARASINHDPVLNIHDLGDYKNSEINQMSASKVMLVSPMSSMSYQVIKFEQHPVSKKLISTNATSKTWANYLTKKIYLQLQRVLISHNDNFYVVATHDPESFMTSTIKTGIWYAKFNDAGTGWGDFIPIPQSLDQEYGAIPIRSSSSNGIQIGNFVSTDMINWKPAEEKHKNFNTVYAEKFTRILTPIDLLRGCKTPIYTTMVAILGVNHPIFLKETQVNLSEQCYLQAVVSSEFGKHPVSELVPFRFLKMIPY